MKRLLQIDWSDLHYSADELSRTIYTFPVHIRVLIGVTLLFILVIFTLLCVIIGSRIYKTRRERLRAALSQKYQPVFMDILFESETTLTEAESLRKFDPADLADPFSRASLMDQIIHLHQNFTGVTAERLEKLYIGLSFHRESLAKLKSRRWYIAAKGMRELALMNVSESYPQMIKFLRSKNEILRMETRIAMMKLSENEPLAFLSKETEALSHWDQANIYAMLCKMPDHAIPDFSFWLNSGNPSVVKFCISMIGAFRQQQSIPVLIRMLDEKDHAVLMAVTKSLRSLSATAAEERLISLYPLVDTELKNEILRTLEFVGKEASAALMEQILRQPVTDYPLSIQAVRALRATTLNGQQRLDQILNGAGAKLQLIVQHANDRRL